jgi:hypothetical protein
MRLGEAAAIDQTASPCTAFATLGKARAVPNLHDALASIGGSLRIHLCMLRP